MAHAVTDVCEEIPVQAPWSFGPIPPGALKSPSYAESVNIAVDWSVDWLLTHRRTFMLGGYSQGAEAAARVHAELALGGRLETVSHLYVGGFAFGNPSRQLEHTFYQGPPRDGEGIAQFRQTGMGDSWADEVDDGDMYGGVPARLTGEIMRDVYNLCVELQMHDMTQFTTDLVANMIEVVQNLDGNAYDDLKEGAERHGVELQHANLLTSEQLQPLSDKISVRGIAATIEACVLGLMFLCQSPPTAPHIEYHLREVFPGQTYVAHAIQHVRDWANRVAPIQETA